MNLYLLPPLYEPEPELPLELVHVGAGCECYHCSSSPLPTDEQFCYTVGLSECGHPELLVRGMSPTDSADLLNRWGQVVAEGDRFSSGDLLCEGPEGLRWELVSIEHPEKVLLWANDRYQPGSPRLSALEILPSTRPCRCRDCR